MSVPISARRAQTQDRLLDDALRAFAARGVLASSVEEICELAGFTRGAFYSNFATKDELCMALLERESAVQLERTNQVIADAAQVSQEDLSGLIRVAVTTFVDLHQDNWEAALAQAELRLYALRNPELAPAFRKFEASTVAVFADVLDAAMTTRGFRFVLPAGDVVDLFRAAFDQHTLSNHDDPQEIERLKERLVRLLGALIVTA